MTRLSGQARALLEQVHAQPGLTRAETARVLGVGSGTMTGLVGQLVAARLLGERPAEPSGARGRPTTTLGPHPAGPLVVAVAVAHEVWQAGLVELGGGVRSLLTGPRDPGEPEPTLSAIAGAVRRLRRQSGGRVRALGVSAPGTVLRRRTVDASYLGWHAVDLRAIWPRAPIFVADNDATVSALAEQRRGVAVDAGVVLHLQVEAGLGGAVIDHGRLLAGALGTAGEFGHLPLGDPAVRCPCGAYGCWGTAVDGTAMARRLGARRPRDPVSYGRRVLAAAGSGVPAETAAAGAVAAELGRGAAGLVNALDPDLVVLAGLGADLLETAGGPLRRAYDRGLMSFRRAAPPPLRSASLRETGALLGTGELAWAELWEHLET